MSSQATDVIFIALVAVPGGFIIHPEHSANKGG
jgi:hypothetical protein